MRTDTDPAARRTPFAQLRSFSELFQTYCTAYDDVAAYYAGDFRAAAARREAANRAARHDRERDLLAEVLHEQNERWGATDRTHRHIDQLRDPDSVAVVTGQQVGLLTGPLYTLYKTLTTLRLAEQLAGETGRSVVPVFWVEGEDHDFEEVAGVELLRRNELVSIRYERSDGVAGQPVGRHALTEQIRDVVAQVEGALPDSDFKPALMEHVRDAYRPGTRLEDAFVQFLQALLPEAGLVFINPDDERLKAEAAPLFRRELEAPTALSKSVQQVSRQLAKDYHAQVHVRPTNLFLLTEAGRQSIDWEEDHFQLRPSERTFARDELMQMVEEHPERFSPNVVMRPLMQDRLLPTAAYVAGPGEVAYFAQLGPAYEWAALPRPLIYPRASATLVEGKVQKVLDKFGLTLSDLEADLEVVFQTVVKEAMEVDVDDAFGAASARIHETLNELRPQVEEVDRTMGRALEATRSALAGELNELKDRVVKAEKRNQDEVRAQLAKARDNLLPGGELQERVVNPVYFLNKYGLDMTARLQRQLSLDTTAHQVVEL